MDILACNHNKLKDGVCLFMKNFFLYIKSKPTGQQICDLDNIYCFKNNKVLAISKNVYDIGSRFELQRNIGIHPYYINQDIFNDFLYFISEDKQNKILLRDIKFVDDSIDDSIEYLELQRNIRDNNISYFIENISNIADLYDTDIKSMVVRYNGYDFNILNEGVLNTDAPESVLESFVKDEIINKIILGIY